MLNLALLERALMFFAHPDDETLAAGATIHKLARSGVEVFVAIPGTGVYSREGDEAAHDADLVRLQSDCRSAMGILGVNAGNLMLGDFPDNAFDSLPQLTLNKWIESVISNVKPQVIFTHHQRCANIDHRYCHDAVVIAARPSVDAHIPIICGEVPSSTGYLRPAAFEPNLYIEVTDEDLEAKVQAMLAYAGEARPDPHPRSPEVLRALAKVRGSESGSLYAEAFIAERMFA